MSRSNGPEPRHPQRTLIAVAIIALLLAGAVFFWYVSQVLLVLFAGVLVAIFLDALTRWFQRYARLPRIPSTIIVTMLVVVCAGLAFWVGGPPIGTQISQLIDRVPEGIRDLQALLTETAWGRMLLENMPAAKELVPSPADILGRISGVFSTTLGALANFALVVMIGFYLAVEPDIYVHGILHLLPPQRRERGREVLAAVGHALRWWLAGRIAAMIAVGVLTGLGLWAIGMPLPLALGLIAGLFSFVPYIGPIVSAVPAVLIALAQGPMEVIYVIAVYGAVQFIEGNFITPIVQERVVALPAAMLLTGQVAIGVVFGLLGLLLATPLLVVGIVLVQMLYIQDVLGDDVKVLGE